MRLVRYTIYPVQYPPGQWVLQILASADTILCSERFGNGRWRFEHLFIYSSVSVHARIAVFLFRSILSATISYNSRSHIYLALLTGVFLFCPSLEWVCLHPSGSFSRWTFLTRFSRSAVRLHACPCHPVDFHSSLFSWRLTESISS